MFESLHYDVDIYNHYAVTNVTAVMVNTGSCIMELSWSFELPANAFVSALKMTVGDKTSVGKVKAKEEARAEYEEAKARGRNAGLVEDAADDENVQVVHTSLGPSDRAIINLSFEQILLQRLGKIDYAIDLPDERSSSPLKPARVSVKISLEETDIIVDATVPSHPEAVVERTGLGAFEASFDTKDFTTDLFRLSYSTAPDEDEQHSVTVSESGHFLHPFAPRKGLESQSKDIIFVIDKSGSMGSDGKMETTKEAFGAMLAQLQPSDHFGVLMFDSSNRWLQHLTPTTLAALDTAKTLLAAQPANGGTNIENALTEALRTHNRNSCSSRDERKKKRKRRRRRRKRRKRRRRGNGCWHD